MSANEGIVFNIQNFSVHDGTGIRTIVFLKGCPLRCAWCSNPESQMRKPQLGFNPMKCLTTDKCTRCIDNCPQGAISPAEGGLIAMDPEKCVRCHTCAEHCAANALNVYGKTMTVKEVIREVEKEAAFYARSGGGMTLSGGEAMSQPKFAVALLKEAKRHRIKTAMETCSYAHYDDLKAACEYLDEVIMDIKAIDDGKHKQGTGVSNQRILENIKCVVAEFPNKPILIRTPVIPGFNDTEEEIRGIVDFIPVQSNIRYELLPYHRMGQPKYSYLGMEYPYEGKALDKGVMERLRVLEREANERFKNAQ
ncbi:glycyl-radical enzyme activating protein [Pseudodesulfovibrio thermohalotolerans]|uniref:(2S)-3-sulfopropanediol dehydratase activating enzyme n=1 Tax=Pseudodesulfovibrio thermohalotolerans TaxID=2880651 RepID=UPI0024419B1E|nr:glycyl-radical enzyme activating protein [Pseudodesulfovibrio thermohalotolerans]WFS62805.1 glycyl-radical enzyme activating protein [Pseudodesulfovibrio thermohalotolerans]